MATVADAALKTEVMALLKVKVWALQSTLALPYFAGQLDCAHIIN